uniref:Uncharacterized protein n=1 Tax=Pyrodinium bahamense TaxID=73915 RepID=A0A7S0BCS4_9DINO
MAQAILDPGRQDLGGGVVEALIRGYRRIPSPVAMFSGTPLTPASSSYTTARAMHPFSCQLAADDQCPEEPDSLADDAFADLRALHPPQDSPASAKLAQLRATLEAERAENQRLKAILGRGQPSGKTPDGFPLNPRRLGCTPLPSSGVAGAQQARDLADTYWMTEVDRLMNIVLTEMIPEAIRKGQRSVDLTEQFERTWFPIEAVHSSEDGVGAFLRANLAQRLTDLRFTIDPSHGSGCGHVGKLSF